MNQRHTQDMSHASVDLHLMVESVAQEKNGIMISANVSVKNQQYIAHVKKIMFGILVHVLVTVINIMRLVNT